MRCHVLPVQDSTVNFSFMEKPVIIKTLAAPELFGSKIKALLERTAARDLFDINNMITNNTISGVELPILRKCVLFYKTVGSTGPFKKDIRFDQIDELTFTNIRRTLLPVLRKSEHVDLPGMQKNVKSFVADLLVLSEKEMQYLRDFSKGKYKPELLFEDPEILDRIKEHPMALWKVKQIREDVAR